MDALLTEDQELLRASAVRFAGEKFGVGDLRHLRDSGDRLGFSRSLWQDMARLGWTGIPFDPEHGGAGLGWFELGLVLNALGERLAVTPYLSTVVLCGGLIARGGTPAQRDAILPRICTGETILALAAQETPRFDPYAIATTAERDGDIFRLNGSKLLVFDAAVADRLVVAARTSFGRHDWDGLTLLLVDPATPGISMDHDLLVDSRRSATVHFRDVVVSAEAVIGEVDRGAALLDPVYDIASICLSAEMLGGVTRAFDMTVDYLKEREQFGVRIGTFQALKHRAAQWFCEVELTRAIVIDALRAIDAGDDDLPRIASVCKARAADTFMHSGQEGIQMHGGIGMTDEHDIGFFLKRARVCQQLFGDSLYHRNRYAVLSGY